MWLCSQQTEATRLFQLVDLRCCDIPAAHLLLETPIQVILPQPASETWVENQKLWIHQVLSEAICVIYRKSEDVNQRHVKSLVSKSQVLEWIITIMNIIPLSKSQNRYDIYYLYIQSTKKTPPTKLQQFTNTSPLVFSKCLLSWFSLPLPGCAPWHRESSRAKARSSDPHRCVSISKTSEKFGCFFGGNKTHKSWWMFWCFGNVQKKFESHLYMSSWCLWTLKKVPLQKGQPATGKGNIRVISDIISYARTKNMLCTCQVVSQGAMLFSGRVYIYIWSHIYVQ